MSMFDFSEYQGTIDFGKVKGNADLLILRVQAGSSHPDKDYTTYVAGCKTNGIPFGSYAYARYISVSDAQQEAKDCFARMDKSTQFVVIDVESVSTTVASQLVSATQAFIDYLHAQGVKKVGLYSGENFYKEHGLSAVKADFLWIANYGANDGNEHSKPSIPCDLWQYSSVATENGVVGHVDIDTINGSKPLSYFTGMQVEAVATSVPSQLALPPVFGMKNVVYAKVQSVGGNDIRKAPTHNSEFVRNTNPNEVFDAYDFVNGFYNVGGANWIDSNGGNNSRIIQTVHPAPVDPHQEPVFGVRNVVFAKVKSIGGNDIRKAPTHNSDYVRNTADGEVFDAYDFVGGFFNVGGYNWIDSNGGKNAYVIQYIYPEPQPVKVVTSPLTPVVSPKPVVTAPAPTPAPVTQAKPAEPVQTSANVAVVPSANTSTIKIDPSGNTAVSGGVISSGNTVAPVDNITNDVASKISNDPIVQQAEKNILQKVIEYILSIFKGGK